MKIIKVGSKIRHLKSTVYPFGIVRRTYKDYLFVEWYKNKGCLGRPEFNGSTIPVKRNSCVFLEPEEVDKEYEDLLI